MRGTLLPDVGRLSETVARGADRVSDNLSIVRHSAPYCRCIELVFECGLVGIGCHGGGGAA